MQEDSLHDLIRTSEHSMVNDDVKTGKYVRFNHYDTVERIHAYLNSKHITGEVDELGREKPFFNVVVPAVNIWYRATDIDRKDIRFVPTKASSVVLAFVANVLLQRWMDKANFGKFLNMWGRTLAEYGSALTKFVEQKGELVAKVVPWNRAIVDTVDFDALPSIEKLSFTPAQLKKKKEYDQQVVKSLLDAISNRRDLEGQNVDLKNDFIEVYEVHGELSEKIYKEAKGQEASDGDEDKYSQQMHVVSFVGNEEGEYDDFTLLVAKEKKDPVKITHLIESDGQTLSTFGAVQMLFDAQWMQNHTVKNTKDTLDLAARMVFQTSDQRYMGRNVLNNIETGQILHHKPNEPLTRLANDKPDILAQQNFGAQWKQLSQELTNTPDLTRGQTQAQPVTFGLGQILNNNSNSLFELMTENKGIHIEEMLREYVIPHIKKTLKNKDEVVAVLDSAGIEEIDAMYVPREAVKRFNKRTRERLFENIEEALQGNVPSPLQPFNADEEQRAVQEELSQLGNMRFLKPDEFDKKTWDDLFSDFEWDNIRVEVTNENTDKQAILQTLTSLYQTVVQNDPDKANKILGKIMNETGVFSPLESASVVGKPAPQPDQEQLQLTEAQNGR